MNYFGKPKVLTTKKTINHFQKILKFLSQLVVKKKVFFFISYEFLSNLTIFQIINGVYKIYKMYYTFNTQIEQKKTTCFKCA